MEQNDEEVILEAFVGEVTVGVVGDLVVGEPSPQSPSFRLEVVVQPQESPESLSSV